MAPLRFNYREAVKHVDQLRALLLEAAFKQFALDAEAYKEVHGFDLLQSEQYSAPNATNLFIMDGYEEEEEDDEDEAEYEEEEEEWS
jgi:hypothetical protein